MASSFFRLSHQLVARAHHPSASPNDRPASYAPCAPVCRQLPGLFALRCRPLRRHGSSRARQALCQDCRAHVLRHGAHCRHRCAYISRRVCVMRFWACSVGLTRSRLTLSDLVLVLEAGKNSKTVGKFCGKLREGGLITVYVRICSDS